MEADHELQIKYMTSIMLCTLCVIFNKQYQTASLIGNATGMVHFLSIAVMGFRISLTPRGPAFSAGPRRTGPRVLIGPRRP